MFLALHACGRHVFLIIVLCKLLRLHTRVFRTMLSTHSGLVRHVLEAILRVTMAIELRISAELQRLRDFLATVVMRSKNSIHVTLEMSIVFQRMKGIARLTVLMWLTTGLGWCTT